MNSLAQIMTTMSGIVQEKDGKMDVGATIDAACNFFGADLGELREPYIRISQLQYKLYSQGETPDKAAMLHIDIEIDGRAYVQNELPMPIYSKILEETGMSAKDYLDLNLKVMNIFTARSQEVVREALSDETEIPMPETKISYAISSYELQDYDTDAAWALVENAVKEFPSPLSSDTIH